MWPGKSSPSIYRESQIHKTSLERLSKNPFSKNQCLPFFENRGNEKALIDFARSKCCLVWKKFICAKKITITKIKIFKWFLNKLLDGASQDVLIISNIYNFRFETLSIYLKTYVQLTVNKRISRIFHSVISFKSWIFQTF